MSSATRVDRNTLLQLAADARAIANPPGQIPPGALAGERISRQQGRGLNFDSLRRYQPGDDVRLIDWQATARMRTPWIRLYNEEKERPIFLLVDQRLDMFFSTRVQTKSVAAAKVAALLGWRSWHDGDRLGGVVFGDSDLALHKCRSPGSTLPTLLDDLVRFNQGVADAYPYEKPQPFSLAAILRQSLPSIPSGSWVALISDFHDLDNECDALLTALRRRGEVSAFVMLDDLHLRMPSHGRLAARYEGQETTFSLTPSLQDEIKQSVTSRLAAQESRLTRLGIRVNQIVVAGDLLRQLQQGV
ncbi:DUF58 domain-containing protein [Salmonella enterica subsp. enterica serovar Oslo]|nr:DUF58 domain-containing protein [Salmonella enterica]EBB9036821.1 DUF58 domain-containing protein [Salmonella enterica subsp. enterica serovar Oslo]ECD0768210.1 DUF58 domain-containing protein [Salmonella enterica subsp. enterica serovar Papuana]EAN4769825.1 DUF58 domain-containing protein [Salmonella enterica]EAS5669507.1 DUF58 domain-containing protein [Salmonella enterica]